MTPQLAEQIARFLAQQPELAKLFAQYLARRHAAATKRRRLRAAAPLVVDAFDYGSRAEERSALATGGFAGERETSPACARRRYRDVARESARRAARAVLCAYASAEYRDALDSYAMVASMSRTGDCWDSAVAESFFATLRAELVDHETYATGDAAERAIGQYIEGFYNAERLHSHLDYVSPIEFELKAHVAAFAA